MSDDLWRVRGVFHVSRRVPWDVDDALRSHLDSVVDALTEYDVAAEIDLDADLESARVVLALTVVGDPESDRESSAREVLSDAIRGCGGRHEGLLPLGVESRLPMRSGPWSGLRTPNWTVHGFTSEPVETD